MQMRRMFFCFEPIYDPDHEYPDKEEADMWDWDNLSGPQLKKVHKAILSGFPERQELESLLLYDLNVRLNDFDDSGGMNDTVFCTIKFFDSRGRIKELVLAAARLLPNHPYLEELSKKA